MENFVICDYGGLCHALKSLCQKHKKINHQEKQQGICFWFCFSHSHQVNNICPYFINIASILKSAQSKLEFYEIFPS